MNKITGTILLISGICIGSGMIAMPILLAKIGIVATILTIIATWLLTFYSSLVTIELHLNSKKSLSIGELGFEYSGSLWGVIGNVLLKLLSFALVAVYISGLTSITRKMVIPDLSSPLIALIITFFTGLLLLLPVKVIDYFNRLLMIFLIWVFLVLLSGLTTEINWHNLPFSGSALSEFSSWSIIIPVLFTSFGFQGSLHSIVSYCGLEPKNIKKAIFWGTSIPAIVYIIWAVSCMSVIFNQDIEFYSKMSSGSVEVGEFINKLSSISSLPLIEFIVGWLSFLAILTSLIGVGLGLVDSIKPLLPQFSKDKIVMQLTAVLISILPSYLLSVLIPNAFIAILGFAGMILTILAILMPIKLFVSAKLKNPHFEELKNNFNLILFFIFGAAIIILELFNMIF